MELYPKQQPIYDHESNEVSRAGKRSVSVVSDTFDVARKRRSSEMTRKLVHEKSKLAGLKELELDGFSSLAEASSWCARVFWLMFLLLVLTLLAYELNKTIRSYIYQPVLTTYTIRKNESMKFPTLMVCFGNVFNESQIKRFAHQKQAAMVFQKMLFNQSASIEHKKKRPKRAAGFEAELPVARLFGIQELDIDLEMDPEWVEPTEFDVTMHRSEREASNSTMTNSSNVQMKMEEFYSNIMNAGFEMNQIFLECKFFSNNTQEVIPCQDIVQEVLDVNYAKCFLVSVGDRVQNVESKGLSLTINTLNSQNSRIPEIVKRYKGLFLSVDETYNPTSWEKVLVGGGIYMKLDVSLEHLQLTNIDSGGDDAQPCVSKKDALLNTMNATYTLSTCQLDCFIAQLVKHCKCLLVMEKTAYKTDILSKYGFCEYSTQQECIIPKVVNDQRTSDAMDECREQCHIQCDSWRYKVSPSVMALNPTAFQYLQPIPHTDILHLDMSYRSLEYKELIQSYDITIDTFIGNLGGQITLWIGGSMMTLINVPIVISSYMFRKSSQKAKNRLLFRQETMSSGVTGFQNAISSRIQSMKN